MDQTLGDKAGSVVHVTRSDLAEMRKSKFGVMKFLALKASHKKVFKIKFEAGQELKYSDIKMYSEHDKPIDDGDFINYDDKTNANKKWIFHRELSESDETAKTDGIARIISELKLRGLQDDLTVNNIRNLVPTESMINVTEATPIETFDKKIICRIAALKTVQVVNCGQEENDFANVSHPFALFRIFSLEKLILPTEENVEIPGIFIPYYYYSFRWSHTVFHIEDNCYVSINIHAGGADKVWTCVSALDEKKFWEKVKAFKSETPKYRDNCTAFMRTKSVLITHHQLDEWGISYSIFIQKEGEVIITPVGCPHQVISLGDCINHTVNLIDPAWCRLSKDEKYICGKIKLHRGAHGGERLNVNAMGLLKRFMDNVAQELAELETSSPSTTLSSSSSFADPIIAQGRRINRFSKVIPTTASSCAIIAQSFSKPQGRKRVRSTLDSLSLNDVNTQSTIESESIDLDEICIACKTAHPPGLCRGLSCITCGINYAAYYATRKHIVKVHKGGKKRDAAFKCDLCDKSFSAKRNLYRHKRDSHKQN